MLDHFTFDRDLEKGQFLVEDFVSTNPDVCLSVDGELHDATAELRGHALTLTLECELTLTGHEKFALCCTHITGLYRFSLDLVDESGTVLTFVRSTSDPMSRRISVRGKIAVDVELHPTDAKLGASRRGVTQDLSRGGMSLLLDEEIPIETDWDITIQAWADEGIKAVGRILRLDGRDHEGFRYGIAFTHIDKEAERKLLDFVLANADIATEESV